MKVSIQDFVQNFISKKIQNTKADTTAVERALASELVITDYIPFREKREIAETIVEDNAEMVDGVWKIDSINQYVTFVLAMLESHTNLTIGEDPVLDYDALAKNKLLAPIIQMFKADYDEAETVLKMATAAKLEDNQINILAGKFLNGILTRLDGVGEVLKNVNLKDLIGVDLTEKDIASLRELTNKLK